MTQAPPPPILVVILPALVILVAVLAVFYMRSKGYANGGGKNVIVRCSDGHLFTTIWIPLVSFKAVRLGPYRFQHCPVGNHLALVTVVDPETLTAAELKFAQDHHDSQIP